MKKKQLSILITGTLLAIAAAFLLTGRQRKGQKEQPPKGAPQLDLQHPGDQSEFLTAATESEMG
jgi:hypothetical protein